MTDPTYGPDMFYSDIEVPNPATVLNEPMPRAWAAGGMIEAVKTSVITGLRASFGGTTMDGTNMKYYIGIEYPTKTADYPGIWVQFSIDKLERAGIGMGTWTKDGEEWGEIQEWMFNGRITLTIAAESSKDRDRLADTVISQLAFSRSVDLTLRNTTKDTKEKRGLFAVIEDNPYVSMTINTDQISPGGQTVTSGTPWAPNMLLYEDNYSVNCLGQFNLRFSHDGIYSLAEIRTNGTISSEYPLFEPPYS